MTIRIKGIRPLKAELKAVTKNLRGARLRKVLRDSALDVQRDARRNIGGGGSRLNIDTGALRRAITWDWIRRGRLQGVEIGPTGGDPKIYGWIHETGAGPWEKKPFLGPALEKNRDKIMQRLGRAIFKTSKPKT